MATARRRGMDHGCNEIVGLQDERSNAPNSNQDEPNLALEPRRVRIRLGRRKALVFLEATSKEDQHRREYKHDEKSRIASSKSYKKRNVAVIQHGDDKGRNKRRNCEKEVAEPGCGFSHNRRLLHALRAHNNLDKMNHVVSERNREHGEVGRERKDGEELKEYSERTDGKVLELVNIKRVEISSEADNGENSSDDVNAGNDNKVDSENESDA